MLGCNHVSVNIRMSGSDDSMMVASSYRLCFMLWQFMTIAFMLSEHLIPLERCGLGGLLFTLGDDIAIGRYIITSYLHISFYISVIYCQHCKMKNYSGEDLLAILGEIKKNPKNKPNQRTKYQDNLLSSNVIAKLNLFHSHPGQAVPSSISISYALLTNSELIHTISPCCACISVLCGRLDQSPD